MCVTIEQIKSFIICTESCKPVLFHSVSPTVRGHARGHVVRAPPTPQKLRPPRPPSQTESVIVVCVSCEHVARSVVCTSDAIFDNIGMPLNMLHEAYQRPPATLALTFDNLDGEVTIGFRCVTDGLQHHC
ncbi:hypothetical protein KGM_203482 [Danaus plexippus plexippus]|uniref:Uncharacterized protein n=1 Tax=Danaus plexippus plexippus TaxID=278856 RepID=A0A212FKJ6_DANPL|nr:hypothetical protein KGM_203482 [Danaus plexippus plexippus]